MKKILLLRKNKKVYFDFSNAVSRYKFENDLIDSIGSNDLTGTDIAYSSFGVNKGLVLNGTTSKAKALNTTNFSFSGTTNFSYSLLFKLNSMPPSQCSLMEMVEQTVETTMDKQLKVLSNGTAQFYAYDGALKYASTSIGDITINTLYHLVGTYDGVNIEIYLNGIIKDTTAVTSTYPTTQPSLIISSLSSGSSAVDGFIDEATVWNKALSQEEITNLSTYQLAGIEL